jgi:predicted DNA-binding transcriptional regulator AlpA
MVSRGMMTTCELPCAEVNEAPPVGGEVVYVEEMLERLGRVSFSTLKRWWKRGRFPQPMAGWPGRRLVWSRRALDHWYAERLIP